MLRDTPRGARSLEFLEGDEDNDKSMDLAARQVMQEDQALEVQDMMCWNYRDISRKFTGVWVDKFYAFAMGTHDRIGGDAKCHKGVHMLSVCVTKMILMSIK
jgi:hypothetical protein